MTELKRMFLTNVKQLFLWNKFLSFQRNSQRIAVGRFCNNINTSNLKAHYANEDHCGPCGYTTMAATTAKTAATATTAATAATATLNNFNRKKNIGKI